MDRVYEGNETRQLALDLGLIRRSAAEDEGRALGVRPRDAQAPQRSRATVPAPEGPPQNLLSIREVRRDVPWRHQLRADRQRASTVLAVALDSAGL